MRSHSINAKAELTRERQRAPESGRTGERERGRERAAKLTSLGGEFSALSFRNSARSHSLSFVVCLSVCLLALSSLSLFLSRTTSLPSLLYLSLSDFVCSECVCETKWLENHGAGAAGFRTRLDFVLRRVLVVCVHASTCVCVCVWVCLIYAATACVSVLLFGLPAVWI